MNNLVSHGLGADLIGKVEDCSGGVGLYRRVCGGDSHSRVGGVGEKGKAMR